MLLIITVITWWNLQIIPYITCKDLGETSQTTDTRELVIILQPLLFFCNSWCLILKVSEANFRWWLNRLCIPKEWAYVPGFTNRWQTLIKLWKCIELFPQAKCGKYIWFTTLCNDNQNFILLTLSKPMEDGKRPQVLCARYSRLKTCIVD